MRGFHRSLLVMAAALVAAMPDQGEEVMVEEERPVRRIPIRPERIYYEATPLYRRKEPNLDMTKREHREMMQRDFALGGSRQGRRRRQRLHRCRHKE